MQRLPPVGRVDIHDAGQRNRVKDVLVAPARYDLGQEQLEVWAHGWAHQNAMLILASAVPPKILYAE